MLAVVFVYLTTATIHTMIFMHQPPKTFGAGAGCILFSGVSVRECLCVPKNLVNTMSQKQWREFHPILITGAFGVIDVLRFWSQRVKGQCHSRQRAEKPGEYNIFVTVGANFTKIRSHVIRFSGQKVKGQGHSRRRHNGRRQAVEFHVVESWNNCSIIVE